MDYTNPPSPVDGSTEPVYTQEIGPIPDVPKSKAPPAQKAVGACVVAAKAVVAGEAPATREGIAEALWAILRLQGHRALAIAKKEAEGGFVGVPGYDVKAEISAFVRGLKTYQEIRGSSMRGRRSLDPSDIDDEDERGKLIKAFSRSA